MKQVDILQKKNIPVIECLFVAGCSSTNLLR